MIFKGLYSYHHGTSLILDRINQHEVLARRKDQEYLEIHCDEVMQRLDLTDAMPVLPGKLTCPLKINGWKMYFLLK